MVFVHVSVNLVARQTLDFPRTALRESGHPGNMFIAAGAAAEGLLLFDRGVDDLQRRLLD
jgi:hypothetical protein